jgi:hypothetical protein
LKELTEELNKRRERVCVSKRGIQSDLMWLNITPPAATTAVTLQIRLTVCIFGATDWL